MRIICHRTLNALVAPPLVHCMLALKMNRRTSTILILLLMSGCAVLGSKEALKISNETHWKTVKTGQGGYYRYSCGTVVVSIDEVVFKSRIKSYGPLLPIIPSGSEKNHENEKLKLIVEIIGYSDLKAYTESDFNIDVDSSDRDLHLSDQSLIKISDSYIKEKGRQWIQYIVSYKYDDRLSNINELKVRFKYPFNDCSMPELSLVREQMKDNELIISPGI